MEFILDAQLARTGLTLGCLLVASLAVMRLSGIGLRGDLLGSAVRAVVQLTLVAVVIGWLFANPQWSLVYVAIMLGAATLTAVRRIGCGPRHSWRVRDCAMMRSNAGRRSRAISRSGPALGRRCVRSRRGLLSSHLPRHSIR